MSGWRVGAGPGNRLAGLRAAMRGAALLVLPVTEDMEGRCE